MYRMQLALAYVSPAYFVRVPYAGSAEHEPKSVSEATKTQHATRGFVAWLRGLLFG
jgi:hypothetical protein